MIFSQEVLIHDLIFINTAEQILFSEHFVLELYKPSHNSNSLVCEIIKVFTTNMRI